MYNLNQVRLLGGWRATALNFVACASVDAYLPLNDKQAVKLEVPMKQNFVFRLFPWTQKNVLLFKNLKFPVI